MILDCPNPFIHSWETQEAETIQGASGFVQIKSLQLGEIRMRWAEYSPNYEADHWCDKGHIVHVVSGALILEHVDQAERVVGPNTTYVVGDHTSAHKARSTIGATVFIVD